MSSDVAVRFRRTQKRQSQVGDFVARTVAGVTDALQLAVYDQTVAALPGLLQRSDPRAKLGSALALLLAVALSHHLQVILAVCVATMVLAGVSRVPLAPFIRRVWLGIPLFACVVAIPSLFLISGRPLLTIVDAPPLRLIVTDRSAWGAALFVARVGASVSVAVLLVSTTRWADLLRALRVVGLPESLVVVLGMTYRYLFLLLHSASNLFLARASRTVGRTSGAEQRRWAAGATGALMGKSMRLSGEVLLAMRARGFAGQVRTAPDPTMGDEDWLLLLLSVAISASLMLLDLRLA